MSGNTYSNVGQRSTSVAAPAMPAVPSTRSQYKSMGQPRADAVTRSPGMAKGGVSQFPRSKRFGVVPKGVMGVVNTGTFKAGG